MPMGLAPQDSMYVVPMDVKLEFTPGQGEGLKPPLSRGGLEGVWSQE